MRHLFVDVRFDLADHDAGERAFLGGHVPGAVFLDVHRDLAGPPSPERGRHPLPDPEAFALAASRVGIGPGVFVVAYDDRENRGAARLWWLLRHFGHDDVAVMSGGIDAWKGPLETGPARAEPAAFVARGRSADVMEADELARRLGEPGLLVLDARSPERFRGEPSPLDPVPGHVPGAVNVPYTDPTVPAAAADAGEIVVYCGSGLTACVNLLELAAAGRPDAKLYPGSWSQWGNLDLPVERG